MYIYVRAMLDLNPKHVFISKVQL